jgi:hypothetical protein
MTSHQRTNARERAALAKESRELNEAIEIVHRTSQYGTDRRLWRSNALLRLTVKLARLELRLAAHPTPKEFQAAQMAAAAD